MATQEHEAKSGESLRLFVVAAAAGLMLSLTLLALVRIYPSRFNAVFAGYLETALEAAASSLPWEQRAAFRVDYAPFLAKHFIDHTSVYLLISAGGFASVLFAARRLEWASAIGISVRIWIVVASLVPFIYIASHSSLVPWVYAIVIAVLFVMGLRNARAVSASKPPKKKRARAWRLGLRGQTRRTGVWLVSWVLMLLVASAAVILRTPEQVEAYASSSSTQATAARPAAEQRVGSVKGQPGVDQRLCGTWQLDGAALVQTSEMKAFISKAPDPKLVERQVLEEARGDLFEFREDMTCARQYPAPASMPGKAPRVSQCAWRVVERQDDGVTILVSNTERVSIRFVGKDALLLTVAGDRDAKRYVRSDVHIPQR